MNEHLISLPLWHRFSKKLAARIENPRNIGLFCEEEALHHEMRLAIGRMGEVASGKQVILYLLVDENDGLIADAKFQAFGPVALIAAADAVCDLVLRKSYVQAERITAELLDRHLRDKTDHPAFPEETACLLNFVLEAVELAAEQCSDIPYHDVYIAPPVTAGEQEATMYSGWDDLDIKSQVLVLEEVIAKEIRPYIELDAGGVEILNIIKSREVIIAYQGSCTTCYSATGATLNAIQQVLRSKIHPELRVTPDPHSLTPNI